VTRRWWAAACACGALVMGGCAAPDPSSGAAGLPPPGDTAIPSAISTPAPTRLQFSGRLSLRLQQPRTGAADGGTVLFEFDGHPQEGSLMLQSVIGTTVATARWGPQGAEIITPQGTRSGARLDEVATVLLGQSLPLEALLHWVRAEPWDKAAHEMRADGFEQLGWTISLEAWHERLITARRPARADRPQDWDITVRARLDEPTPVQQRSGR